MALGDETEDPWHPKIVWPASIDCPNCRIDWRQRRSDLFNLDPQIALVEGHFWNLTELVDHHIMVYGADELVVVSPLLPKPPQFGTIRILHVPPVRLLT